MGRAADIPNSKKLIEHGHVFVDLADEEIRQYLSLKALRAGMVCLYCGMMRNSNGSNKPCKGVVKIGMR